MQLIYHDPINPPDPQHTGFCRDTMRMEPITELREDGCEYSYQGPTGIAPWATEDTSVCPFLNALSRIPTTPPQYEEETLRRRWQEAIAQKAFVSCHRGVVKQRADWTLTYEATGEGVTGDYGTSYPHHFKDGADKFVWWTSKLMTMVPGETRTVKATVKEHRVHRGHAVTAITRVSPLKGEAPITQASEDQHAGDE